MTLVPKAPGADHELLFVNLPDVRNVVPIIDSGEAVAYGSLTLSEPADQTGYTMEIADPALLPIAA